MILDTSAIVAVFLKEPGFEGLLDRLAGAPVLGIGTPTIAETGIVLGARLRSDARGLLARFFQKFEVQVVSFDEPHWQEAVLAWQRFGKGRHPAALNFGDCLSYATARLAGRPLLFVGDDFARTDIEAA
jgi:ribonuclease VapC